MNLLDAAKREVHSFDEMPEPLWLGLEAIVPDLEKPWREKTKARHIELYLSRTVARVCDGVLSYGVLIVGFGGGSHSAPHRV